MSRIEEGRERGASSVEKQFLVVRKRLSYWEEMVDCLEPWADFSWEDCREANLLTLRMKDHQEAVKVMDTFFSLLLAPNEHRVNQFLETVRSMRALSDTQRLCQQLDE